jgi:hypothetical protein
MSRTLGLTITSKTAQAPYSFSGGPPFRSAPSHHKRSTATKTSLAHPMKHDLQRKLPGVRPALNRAPYFVQERSFRSGQPGPYSAGIWRVDGARVPGVYRPELAGRTGGPDNVHVEHGREVVHIDELVGTAVDVGPVRTEDYFAK